MKDQQIIDILRERDAVFLDEITHYNGQITPNLKILDSKGERVELPNGVHINHVQRVLERHGALVEVGLTPMAGKNLDSANKKLTNPNLMNFEVSEINSELADLSSKCVRRKIIDTNPILDDPEIKAAFAEWVKNHHSHFGVYPGSFVVEGVNGADTEYTEAQVWGAINRLFLS